MSVSGKVDILFVFIVMFIYYLFRERKERKKQGADLCVRAPLCVYVCSDYFLIQLNQSFGDILPVIY